MNLKFGLKTLDKATQKQISINFSAVKFWHFVALFSFLVALLVIFHLLGISDANAYPLINKDIFFSYK